MMIFYRKKSEFKTELEKLRRKYKKKILPFVIKELGKEYKKKKDIIFKGREEQEYLLYKFIDKKCPDLIGVLPTNSGKSLIFRAGAMYLKQKSKIKAPSVVVSPLISLMSDQVKENDLMENLKNGIIVFNSNIIENYSDYYNEAKKRLRKGDFCLMYVSPERFRNPNFLPHYKKLKIARFVIDEMHCYSLWGDKFRFEYKKLPDIISYHPDARLILLTASAEKTRIEETLTGLIDKLPDKTKRLKKSTVVLKDLRRREIKILKPIRCAPTKEENARAEYSLDFLRDILNNKKSTALIFTMFARPPKMKNNWNCERLYQYYLDNAKFLGLKKKEINRYHAQMHLTLREEIQKGFTNGNIRLLVCTKAFGMGVNMPNIRAVVHMYPPATPEDYYQEIGRGGRDAKINDPCYAQMIYSDDDERLLNRLIKQPWIFRTFQAFSIISNGCIYVDEEDFKISKEFRDFLKKWFENKCISKKKIVSINNIKLSKYQCSSKSSAKRMVKDALKKDSLTKYTKNTVRWLTLFAHKKNNQIIIPPPPGLPLFSIKAEYNYMKNILATIEEEGWVVRNETDEHINGDVYSTYKIIKKIISRKEIKALYQNAEYLSEKYGELWKCMQELCGSGNVWKNLMEYFCSD